MRAGEIFSLQWSQVDFNSKRIKVERTKNGKYRLIPVNTPLFNELQRLHKQKTPPYVFTNPRTQKPYTTVKTAFLAACRRAGIENLRFHDLRHTFATRLIEAGVDIETVRDLLGHYSVTLTQRYTHSNNKQKSDAVKALERTKEKMEKKPILLHRRYTDKKKPLPEEKTNPLSHLISWN
ncbi:MAG: site-specific integrase [Deltaproteobacteria bacterium]|nr:site-specific integrase [Deltaproteobacteria bacterium]